MSTTSCPRCSVQVTLPVGVSNDATVRCPLCHAHYTLADALVNMPPLLEVVGADEESLAADWLADSADEPEADKLAADDLAAVALPEIDDEDDDAPLATALPFDEMDEEASEAETLELGSLELGSLELGSVELDDELDRGVDRDHVGQETIAEDLGFSTVESPAELEPLAALPADEDDEDLLGDDLLGSDLLGSELGDNNALKGDPLSDFGGEELAAGPAEEDDLPLEFGEELSAEAAGAETMEFSAESLAGFSESDASDLKFDLDAESNDSEDAGGATLDFGATIEEKPELGDVFGEEKGDELAFDSFDAEGETVQFDAEATGFGGEQDLKFDDPLASEAPEGDELRGFEDLRFEPSDDAGDAPDLVPVAPVMAATPVEAVEEPKGKKGKKEKKKKEKKVKVVAEGDTGGKRKRSLVAILLGALIALPAVLYGGLWLGRDYDIAGLSNYLPAVALPAEYSKKTVVAQTYVPPAALPEDNSAHAGDSASTDQPVADAPAEEVPAEVAAPTEELPAGEESTAHTTARPATDDPAASADAMADEAPSLADPTTDAAPAEAMPAEVSPAETPAAAAPAEDDLFAPSTDAPAAEDDPFGAAADAPAADAAAPGTDAPAADAPAADAPAEADPFGPATDAPADAANAPADDLFAPTTETPAAEAPLEEMPAEVTPAAPAEDDLFAPTTDAPAADPAASAEDDPFGAATDAPADVPADAPADPLTDAPADAPAEMPAEEDVFAPPPEPAADPAALPADPAAPAADTTRPAEPDPFAPEPVTPAEEMPAGDDPVDPLTDAPAPAEDVLTPAAPVMPEDTTPDAPPADDPLAIPAEPAVPEPIAPEPTAPEPAAETPAAPAFPAPQPSGERVGPRNVTQVSPQALSGAMQSAFVANQQLIAAEAAADEAALRKARAAFYVNLFGMADAITSAQQGPGAAELDPHLQQLASVLKQQLAADPRRLESLKVFGARWIGFPKRTTDGVVVSGTVESVGQVGQLYHTKARLGSGADAPLVTIVSAADPQLASGDTVLALGSIVERPAEAIAGYQGTEPSVVWSGMAMKVPAN